MSKNQKIIAMALLVIIVAVLIFFNSQKIRTDDAPLVHSIEGCYVALLGQDVYTLNILSQNGENIEGRLVFKNFQKDSSSGTYKGTYKDGILLGDYAFQSEGTDSVMQVIFKKVGDNFVRGYGEMIAEGTRFADTSKIDYNSAFSYEYKKTNMGCAVSL
jgi:hypothetical protein